MGMGTGIGFFKVILYFALMFLTMCLLVLPFINTASPEFVVIVIALAANGITVMGSWMYLHAASKKTHK